MPQASHTYTDRHTHTHTQSPRRVNQLEMDESQELWKLLMSDSDRREYHCLVSISIAARSAEIQWKIGQTYYAIN